MGVLWSAVAIVRSGWRTLQLALPEARECLRARHLVDEVEIDREDGRRIGLLGDDVRIPDLVDDRAGGRGGGGGIAGFHGRAA